MVGFLFPCFVLFNFYNAITPTEFDLECLLNIRNCHLPINTITHASHWFLSLESYLSTFKQKHLWRRPGHCCRMTDTCLLDFILSCSYNNYCMKQQLYTFLCQFLVFYFNNSAYLGQTWRYYFQISPTAPDCCAMLITYVFLPMASLQKKRLSGQVTKSLTSLEWLFSLMAFVNIYFPPGILTVGYLASWCVMIAELRTQYFVFRRKSIELCSFQIKKR